MKSAMLPRILVAALFFSLIPVTPSMAQEELPEVHKEREVGEAAAEADPAEIEDGGATEGNDRIQQPRSRARGSSRKLHRQLTKLQGLMKSRLELSEEQEETIGAFFEQRLESLKKRRGEAEKPRGRAEDREEVREVRDELKEAREAGDKERIRELRQQLGQILRKRRSSRATPIGGFLQLITNELNEDQVLPFRRLVKHVGLNEYGRGRTGSVRELMRAVMSPNVGLSREQRRAIRETFREATGDTRRSTQNPKEQERVYEKLRNDILVQLTPEQRAEVEAALEEGATARHKKRRTDPLRDRDHEEEPADDDDTDEVDTGEDKTEADEAGGEEMEVDETEPDETGSEETEPEKTGPDNP